MDLKKHQQTLMNIRSKYASLTSKTRQGTSTAKKERQVEVKDSQSSYQTPIRILKNQQTASKKKIQVKQSSNTINSSSFKKEDKKQSSRPQLIGNRFSFSKEKTFDEVIAQRDKQLTERTERNKQILSKSKQIRQKQSRNNSVQNGTKNKQNKDGKGQYGPLKLLFQDKNYMVNNDKYHKPTNNHQNPKVQSLYANVKGNITDKMKQNLIQSFGVITEKTTKIVENDKPIVQKRNKCQALRQYSIKTPIPPPKESSPNKIKAIFDNTKNIQERIHALLSR